MRRLALVVFAFGTAVLSAADVQVLTVEAARGAFLISPVITENHTLSRQETVVVNGRAEVQTIHESVPVTSPWPTYIDARAGDYFDRAGRPLDPRAVANLLKAGTVLAVSMDGSSVGPEPLKQNERIAAILILKPWEQFHPDRKDRKKLPPRLGTIGREGNGTLHVEVTVTETVAVQEARTRVVGGRTETVVVTVQVPRTFKARHNLADATLTDLGGNPVDPKSLRVGSRVAVSADHTPVDAAHIQELKGVVAVVVPKELVLP